MRNTRYLGAPLSNYWTGDKLVIPGATDQPWGSGGMFDPNNLPAPLPPGENPQGGVQDQGGQSGGGFGGAALAYGPTILGAANKAYGLFSEGGQTAVEAGADYLKGTEFYRDMFGPDIPPSDPLSNLPQNVPYDAVAPDIFGSPSLGGNAAGNALSYAGNVQAAGAAPSLAPGLPFSGPGAPNLFGAGTAAPLADASNAYLSPAQQSLWETGGGLSNIQGGAGQAVDLSFPAEAWNPTTGEFNFVQAGEPATGQFTTAAGLSNIQGGAGLSTGLPSSAAEFGAGGFAGVGSPAAIAAANSAALGFGGVPITAAHPALSGAGLLGSGQLAATAAAEFGAGGFFGAGAGGAAATPALGGLAAFAPAAMLALPFLGRALLHEETDPTLNKRLTHQFENTAQDEGIEGMEKAIYANPNLYDLARIATSGRTGGHGRVQLASFGTKPTDGSTDVIGWSPELSALVNENMGRLQAASNAGQMNTSGMGRDGPDNYHPTYNPDPNTYEDIEGEYGVMERRLVGGPDFDAQMEGAL